MSLSLLIRASVCPLFALLFASPALRAAEPAAPRTVTVEECLARAAERSLSLRAGAARTDAAAGRTRQASRRLNPRLEAEVENVAGSGEVSGFDAAETTLSLSQEIELGGKRHRRTAVAEAEATVARADEAVQRHELLVETRRAALQALAAQERVRLAEELLALARETEAVAVARERAGKTTSLETERARAETAQAGMDLEDRRADQHEAVLELAGLLGEAEPTFDAVAGSLDAPPAALPGADALLLRAASHPALVAADARRAALDAQVRHEEAERTPNLEVAAGVRRLEESEDYGFVAGIGVELPLFSRSLDAVRAAEAERAAAQLELDAARLKNDAAIRRSCARLQALSAKDARLRETVVPTAERALALVKQAHAQGKAGYLDVLEARRAVAEARSALIDTRAAYASARIDLDDRTGAPAAPVTTAP